MRKIVVISALALLAWIATAEAQSPVQQNLPDQNAKNPATSGGAGANGVQKPAESKDRNSGPPYTDCYLKCINSGNPADYCQDRARSYC